jgi:hypothetical protein
LLIIELNLQLLLTKENKTFLNNYYDKDIRNSLISKEKDSALGYKKQSNKKIISKLHNSFAVKNTSASPSNFIQKSRNNQKSVYNDFVLEKKSFNNENMNKNKVSNNMTISPQKQFISVNNEKNDNKNYSIGVLNKGHDANKKINKVINKLSSNNNNNNNTNYNSIKNHHKVNSVFLTKPTQKYSLRENELVNLSHAIMHTYSDEASSNNTLQQFNSNNLIKNQKNESFNVNKELKLNLFIKNIIESKISQYKESIIQLDFLSLHECISSILQKISKVDEIFTPAFEQFYSLIDIEKSKSIISHQKEQKKLLQNEIEKLNRVIDELKEINKRNISELIKKDSEIKFKEKKFSEEIEIYKKREQKILKMLYLIETGGISLNQVININNNSNVFSNKNNELDLQIDERSKNLGESVSNPDLTVYFPDKTPKISTNSNLTKKFVPKLDFKNLPKYESPVSSQENCDQNNTNQVEDLSMNKNLVLSFNDKFSFENYNLHMKPHNIDSINLSSQSSSKINIAHTEEEEVNSSKKYYLKKEDSYSQNHDHSVSPLKTELKMSNNTQSLMNINEINNNKKYYDLKKLSQTKKLLHSFKTININKNKFPVKLKNSNPMKDNYYYTNTDNK